MGKLLLELFGGIIAIFGGVAGIIGSVLGLIGSIVGGIFGIFGMVIGLGLRIIFGFIIVVLVIYFIWKMGRDKENRD